jgi:uncharacterized protein YecE (DUF72 family)
VTQGEAVKAKCWIGTSGWSYKHWQGVFYPAESPSTAWFSYYARQFPTVEINNTFYHLPAAGTFEKWRDSAPEGFRFAVKANRYITHLKRLLDPAEPLENFLSRARLLGDHLGPILYQLPSRWKLDLPRFANFVEHLPRDLVQAVEFRDQSWLTDDVYRLLEQHGTGFCIISLPNFNCPLKVTSPFVYIRMHGSLELYSSRYTGTELARWAETITGFLEDGREVYVYFNNDAHGYAIVNAEELRDRLVQMGQDVVMAGEELSF